MASWRFIHGLNCTSSVAEISFLTRYAGHRQTLACHVLRICMPHISSVGDGATTHRCSVREHATCRRSIAILRLFCNNISDHESILRSHKAYYIRYLFFLHWHIAYNLFSWFYAHRSKVFGGAQCVGDSPSAVEGWTRSFCNNRTSVSCNGGTSLSNDLLSILIYLNMICNLYLCMYQCACFYIYIYTNKYIYTYTYTYIYIYPNNFESNTRVQLLI